MHKLQIQYIYIKKDLSLTVVGDQHRQQIDGDSLLRQRCIDFCQQLSQLNKCLLSAQRVLAIHYHTEKDNKGT